MEGGLQRSYTIHIDGTDLVMGLAKTR